MGFFAFSPPNTEIQTARRVTDVTTEASLGTIRARRVTDVTTEASLGTIRARRVTDVTTEASLGTIRARRVTDVTPEASLGTIRARRVPVAALDAGWTKKEGKQTEMNLILSIIYPIFAVGIDSAYPFIINTN